MLKLVTHEGAQKSNCFLASTRADCSPELEHPGFCRSVCHHRSLSTRKRKNQGRQERENASLLQDALDFTVHMKLYKRTSLLFWSNESSGILLFKKLCQIPQHWSFLLTPDSLSQTVSNQPEGNSSPFFGEFLSPVVHGCDDFSRTESFVPEGEFVHPQAAVVLWLGVPCRKLDILVQHTTFTNHCKHTSVAACVLVGIGISISSKH